MSIHIHQVMDYLDTHPVCQQTDNMESLLEILYDVYISHNDGNSQEILSLFHRLRNCMEHLTKAEQDALFDAVCDLCAEHEVLAFSQGVLTGMMLMSEVCNLP